MGPNSKQASWDVLDWSQDGGVEIPKPAGQATRNQRQQMPPLRCPRCESTNTKFCYYNNYNRSQPRHFCKACRRHWTEGGTLRNVPVGGGRKNKRPKTTQSTTTDNTAGTNSKSTINTNPMLIQQQQQQLPAPFGGDSNKISIFPDILPQLLQSHHQHLDYSVGSSFSSSKPSLPPFPTQFTGAKPITFNPCDDILPPFSTASSSSSYLPYHNYMRQHPITVEEGLTMTNGSAITSTWQEPSPLAVGMGPTPGCWSGWDDEITGLVAPDLKQSTSNDPQRP